VIMESRDFLVLFVISCLRDDFKFWPTNVVQVIYNPKGRLAITGILTVQRCVVRISNSKRQSRITIGRMHRAGIRIPSPPQDSGLPVKHPPHVPALSFLN
jgi:hypothetical protein